MKSTIFFIFLILITIVSAACNSKKTNDGNTNENTSNDFFEMNPYTSMLEEKSIIIPIYPKSISFNDWDGRNTVNAENLLEEKFVKSINKFSNTSFSAILRENSGNINYSPISLYIALSLVATGADGQTHEEMLSLLGMNGKDNTYLYTQTGNLIRRLYRDNEIGRLKIANSLWLQDDIDFNAGFINNAADNFYASLYNVDFTDSNTAELMRTWISENTGGKIHPQINGSENRIFSILNTIYFKDEWVNRFLLTATSQGDFNLESGQNVRCDYMKKTDYRHFKVCDGFISSYYGLKNGGGMIFILPDKGKSIDELIDASDYIGLFDFNFQEADFGKVIFEVPKFSFGSNLGLKDILISLGIESAFSSDADFSGITDGMAYISNVRQQTHIAIDEKGVEATAFTLLENVGEPPPPEKVIEMILDRPFIYAITSSDGILLFVGVVKNPTI